MLFSAALPVGAVIDDDEALRTTTAVRGELASPGPAIISGLQLQGCQGAGLSRARRCPVVVDCSVDSRIQNEAADIPGLRSQSGALHSFGTCDFRC